MTPTSERISSLLRTNRLPQTALATLAGVNMGTLSLWLRNYSTLPERVCEEIGFTVDAMLEVSDESPTPVDWRQAVKLKPLIVQKVAQYRRERSAQLRERFANGAEPTPAAA